MKKCLVLVCVCLLFLAAGAQAVGIEETYHIEIPDSNLQLLLPTTWNGTPVDTTDDTSIYMFFDSEDETGAHFLILTVMPAAGDVDVSLQEFQQEARSLLGGGGGLATTVVARSTIDRMPAVMVLDNDEPYRLLFIRDGDRILFAMFPDPLEIKDEKYTNDVTLICDSIALLDNPHAPEYDQSAFETAPVDGGVQVTAYSGQSLRVDIPPQIDGEAVVAIGDGAFYEQRIQHVTVPAGVTAIGDVAFSGCNDLRTISLPETLETIGYGAFESCFLLQRIEIPEGVTAVEASAFWGCMALTHVTLPSTLTTLGDAALVMTMELEEINLAEGNTAFSLQDGVLMDRTGKRLLVYPGARAETTYAVPDGVEEIADFAFAYAMQLKSVTLPESVRSIGDMAFIGAMGLRTLTVPEDGIETLGANALTGLESATIVTDPEGVLGMAAAEKGIAVEKPVP